MTTTTTCRIDSLLATCFLRRANAGLEQRLILTLANAGAATAANVEIRLGSTAIRQAIAAIPVGPSTHDLFIPELAAKTSACVTLTFADQSTLSHTLDITPPRHWTVHVTQFSHHDLGYTNLAASVLLDHDAQIDEIIDFARDTDAYPDDAKFRVMIEQAWSIDHYLKVAAPDRAAEMIKLMQSGRVEITALFSNMTTEVMHHETLIRSAQHAFALKRKYNIPIMSAEHNDIPGFSWGLATVLTDAGIKMFSPQIPNYYHWGHNGVDPVRSFWDQKAVIGIDGPGVFWWQAASGKRILFWDANNACGGDRRIDMPGLERQLAGIEAKGYPYSVYRAVVIGAARDNSPYINYAHTIRKWNDTWAYPHLICSTNSKFYADLVQQLPADLPVHRGELPGQDYPCGSMSTAAATGIFRSTQAAFPVAETRCTLASLAVGARNRQPILDKALENILWFGEHVWGHHFPCGPTSAASVFEKSLFAHYARAHTHDASCKSLAAIADAVKIDLNHPHLVVFNPHPHATSAIVRTPMREYDNCGSEIQPTPLSEDPNAQEALRGVILNSHWHVSPAPEFTAGKFDLIDTATGASIPYQIVAIDTADAPTPFAGARIGIGSGGKRYGFFDDPIGMKHDLIFSIDDLPACGYRTFMLRPRTDAATFASPFTVSDDTLENAFYRIQTDKRRETIISIFDKTTKRELLDAKCPYAFGDVLVRSPEHYNTPYAPTARQITKIAAGPRIATIDLTFSVHGHPHIRQTLTLHSHRKQIDFAVSVLKDATPLLDAHLAFPFAIASPTFRYQGVLSTMEPVTDYFPGASWNSIPVQDVVAISNTDAAIAWSSLDAPIASFGNLWTSRVSTAHRCLAVPTEPMPPESPRDLKNGWLFSMLSANNFGTNLFVTQDGLAVYRYTFTSDAPSTLVPHRFAADATLPIEAIFTIHDRPRTLPPTQSLLSIDSPDLRVLTFKHAEDTRGQILRLWNPTDKPITAAVTFNLSPIASATLTSLAEEDTATAIPVAAGKTLTVTCGPNAVTTARVKFK